MCTELNYLCLLQFPVSLMWLWSRTKYMMDKMVLARAITWYYILKLISVYNWEFSLPLFNITLESAVKKEETHCEWMSWEMIFFSLPYEEKVVMWEKLMRAFKYFSLFLYLEHNPKCEHFYRKVKCHRNPYPAIYIIIFNTESFRIKKYFKN